jgi:hypothetical protein
MTRHLPLKYLANYTQIYLILDLNKLYLKLFKFIVCKKWIKISLKLTLNFWYYFILVIDQNKGKPIMHIETQYSYEKIWKITKEDDLLKIIEEEIGDADPKGTLAYVKEAIKNGKTITVGSCRFREQKE